MVVGRIVPLVGRGVFFTCFLFSFSLFFFSINQYQLQTLRLHKEHLSMSSWCSTYRHGGQHLNRLNRGNKESRWNVINVGYSCGKSYWLRSVHLRAQSLATPKAITFSTGSNGSYSLSARLRSSLYYAYKDWRWSRRLKTSCYNCVLRI